MAIAGTLAVNVLAKTDKFNKGIKGARKSLGAFRGAISKATKGLGSLGAALVSGATVAGFVRFFSATVESVDRLSKLSEQIGTTTEDLGLLAFQADLSGVSQDNLAKSMLKMSRTLSDATNGLTTAIRPLDRLGLSAEKLINLKPGEAFAAIASAMKNMENPLMRSATAMELFGRSGAELIPLFNSDMAGAAEQFEKMGGAISQLDANKLVAFKDAMTTLKATAGSFGRDFVIDIAPLALKAVTGLQILFDDLKGGRGGEKADKPGGIGKLLSGAQLFGADFLRGLAIGKALPLQASLKEKARLSSELAGPRTTPAEFNRATRDRQEARIERRKQTKALLDLLDEQQRSTGQTVVTIEPATF